MKVLGLLLKLQRDVLEVSEEEYRATNTEIKAYEEGLTSDSKNPVDKIYIKIHKGPWFAVLSTFLYVFIRKEINKVLNPIQEEYPEERLDRYR
jgi:hypothetical protein